MNQVIFAPDLIGAAFVDPHARAVLERWRDGEFKMVLNRQLLILHLKVLKELGLSNELMKRWTFWMTSPETSVFLAELTFEHSQPAAICEALATAAKAQKIICWQNPPGVSLQWTCVSKFL